MYHWLWYTKKIGGRNPNFLSKNWVAVYALSNNRMVVIIIEILTKLENGDYMEVVDWTERSFYWGWANVYDCPLAAYRGTSCLSPKEVRDEWHKVSSEHRVDSKWKNGDTIIYNPDWTVKAWIKGPAHTKNEHKEECNEKNT